MNRSTTWPMRLRAAGVHVYTASGAVIALGVVLAAVTGDVQQALGLGLMALVIDGTDGMLARRFRVREVLPWFDGRRLDDIVDYLTYVFAPVVLLWAHGDIPVGAIGVVVAALPLLASSYQFCRTDAKTADHFFLGFPSYWNIVAFYVIVFELSAVAVTALLVVLSILVFVPIRYVYPSRTRAWRRVTLPLTGLWLVCYALTTLQLPVPNMALNAFSLAYVVYYVALSLYLTARRAGETRTSAALG